MVMDKDDWYKSWQVHLEQYLKAPPRTGIFIHSYFPKLRSSLEIACGSSRDSIYLAKKGVKATATDYEGRIIDELKNRFNHFNLQYKQADAFNLSFADNSFEIVFHNGFFIYFSDNNKIFLMLEEQARVANTIIFFVHNRLNNNLVKKFRELAPNDPIYDIRFFEPYEVESIVKKSNIKIKNMKIYKFGGKYDVFYSKRIKRIVPNIIYPFREYLIPRLYQLQSWEETERVCCVIRVDK